MSSPQAAPGRVLVVGTDSGWREWEPGFPPGYAGRLVLPNGPLGAYDPQDLDTFGDVRVWSIRDPEAPAQRRTGSKAMTTENNDVAKWAEIDQLLADFGAQLTSWVVTMQNQVARHGPDQALANVALAFQIQRISLDDMKALFVIALQRLAALPPERALTAEPADGDLEEDGESYDPEDARYEGAAGQLNQAVASAIMVAQDLYQVAVNSGGKPDPGAHARLIAGMMGGDQYDAVYQAIIAGESEIGDGSLTQAARDALMPFACGECGAEVSVPGREPDHFDWCPRAEPGPENGADYAIDKP